MSRHRSAFDDEDYYEDDYYYDEYEEEEDASNAYAPPSRTGSALMDFVAPLDINTPHVRAFIARVHDIFGTASYSDNQLLDVLIKNNENDDQAVTALLEEQAAREAAALAAALTLQEAQNRPPPPPGFGSSAPLSPVPKRSHPVGISLSANQAKALGRQQGKTGGTPPKAPPGMKKMSGVNTNISTPPLPHAKRGGGGSRTSSPAIPSSSAVMASRIAPLSDDEYEYEDVSSAAVARLTLVVAGHVDAGKSTLVGHFLYKLGGAGVTQRQMHGFEKAAGEMGKSSFYLAWVMDESESEREHGVTIGLAERYFRTKNFDFTVLDAPGHRDFIPTMITGANQADVALLVIPATSGEFESSMSENAQTREHAVLLKALGVNQVIVVVNKMDMTTPPWSEDRYRFIQAEMRTLLTGLQFGPKAVRFVPVSSLNGINLNPFGAPAASSSSSGDSSPNNIQYARGAPCPELFQWYIGPSLVELLDAFRPPPRETNKPLRASITSIVSESSKGVEVRVKVLQGILRRRRGVGISLIQGAFDVKKISKEDGTSCESLPAGEEATVMLSDRSNRSVEEVRLREGLVLYKGPPYPQQCTVFKATILTFNPLIPPIIPGSSYELYLHGEEHQCHIRKIYSMTSNKLGVVKRPKCVPGDRSACVKIEVSSLISIETFHDCRALGRFALRSRGRTCAVGICDSVKVKRPTAGSDKKAA